MYAADWRVLADYRLCETYDRAGLAWEVLRRNDDYGRDYARLAQARAVSAAEADRFARRWGLAFGADPAIDPDHQAVAWLPTRSPGVLQLQPAGARLAMQPLDLGRLADDPAVDWRRRGDDVLVRRAARHQLRLAPPADGPQAVVLPLDALFDRRLAAALRLWRDLRALAPGPDGAPLSVYARRQLILVLRLIDARHTGAAEREMATAVLGAGVMSRREWLGSDERSRLRRLLRRGRELLAGGYLRLLSPPPRGGGRKRGP
jgi:hypothetical protein